MRTSKFRPSYLELGASGVRERAGAARKLLSPCRLCPRECGVDRLGGEKGFCRTLENAYVSSRNIHQGEEPPISGKRGSGTIFFTNCNLRCIFCQNYPISQMGVGSEVDHRELADMMLNLQNRGAHNINFVTPTHVSAAIIAALAYAISDGLTIPLVWNSSGYDAIETIRLFDGIVDIYMPDMKYAEDAPALKYSNAPHYVKTNQAAIREMHRQVGVFRMDEDGVGERGLLIRHLVLPESAAGSADVLRFIAEELSPDTYVSLMSQYFPANRMIEFPEMNRAITGAEYRVAEEALHRLGLESGYVQNYEL